MTIIPLYTDEEFERVEWFRASSPGMQKQILEVIECVVEKGETEKVRKEARKMLRVMRRRESLRTEPQHPLLGNPLHIVSYSFPTGNLCFV